MSRTCRVTFRCSSTERDDLARLAKLLDRTKGDTLRWLFQKELAACEQQSGKTTRTDLLVTGQPTVLRLRNVESTLLDDSTALVIVVQLDVPSKMTGVSDRPE
jgi:hypothetical protein